MTRPSWTLRFTHPTIEQIAWSPQNPDRLAAVTTEDGSTQAWAWDLRSDERRPRLTRRCRRGGGAHRPRRVGRRLVVRRGRERARALDGVTVRGRRRPTPLPGLPRRLDDGRLRDRRRRRGRPRDGRGLSGVRVPRGRACARALSQPGARRGRQRVAARRRRSVSRRRARLHPSLRARRHRPAGPSGPGQPVRRDRGRPGRPGAADGGDRLVSRTGCPPTPLHAGALRDRTPVGLGPRHAGARGPRDG